MGTDSYDWKTKILCFPLSDTSSFSGATPVFQNVLLEFKTVELILKTSTKRYQWKNKPIQTLRPALISPPNHQEFITYKIRITCNVSGPPSSLRHNIPPMNRTIELGRVFYRAGLQVFTTHVVLFDSEELNKNESFLSSSLLQFNGVSAVSWCICSEL